MSDLKGLKVEYRIKEMIWKRWTKYAHRGRAIAQAVSRRLPTAAARVRARVRSSEWDLWWTKWRWGRFSPSPSVSPANLHSTKFSISIITRGGYNRPFSGRRAEWTQLGLHPPLYEFKRKK
jgi:hypothetical protein